MRRSIRHARVLTAVAVTTVACGGDVRSDGAGDELEASGGTPGTGGRSGSGGSTSAGGASEPGTGGEGSGGSTTCSGDACAAPSCEGLPATCGPSADESCCTSLAVTGGSFHVSYDGVTPEYDYEGEPATVSAFRLDKFEVSVGRFRKFKAAWDGGWRPPAGAGKHTHLHGGRGLVSRDGGGIHEEGWAAGFDPFVAPTDGHLTSCAPYQTWTTSADANESRPITCVTWFESRAFCIWDGGFLPSNAELNYAASGGAEQRKYPWGQSEPGANADLAIYDCHYGGAGPETCTDFTNIAPVGSVSAGNGRYGQADLSGNVWEWTLDEEVAPPASCDDCASLPFSSPNLTIRGGGFHNGAFNLLSSGNNWGESTVRTGATGIRCARVP